MVFDWSKTIFPLLIADCGENGQPVNPKFLGTCFFTVMEGYPIFVTAKHVIEGYEDKIGDGSKNLFFATRYGKNDAIGLPAGSGVAFHNRIDIGILIIEPRSFARYKDEFRQLEISYSELPLGTEVFTFGYPDSAEIYDEFSRKKVPTINNFCFKGYVSNIADESVVGGTKRTYFLSFSGMPGISGAPLVSKGDDKLNCVGLVFSNKLLDGRYEFGLACDAEPLLDMKTIISDFKNQKA
ncbi:MAG: serine protease [candidate division Zixibacteria bacterium]|nr:serine protease [candidate division Zixibacteria bacterium]MDH3936755.1 serine protease [candidate division Zixibacteria bacterium]MDH4033018.1 serine protease [candidate division Zixibacteria bacterium]